MQGVRLHILLFLQIFCIAKLSAQPVDTTITEAPILAQFERATALAHAAGIVYVLDAGRGVLARFEADGTPLPEWGGRGSGDTAFDEPMDVDPTNGLLVYIADAGNRRLKTFTRTFRHLESLVLPTAETARTVDRSSRLFGDSVPVEEGRPLAVGASVAGDVFALESETGVVIKWSASGEIERIIGRYSDGVGALEAPVSLALSPTRLFVADAAQQTVMVYDVLGQFIRTLGNGQLTDLRSVAVYNEILLAIGARRIWFYETQGTLVRTYAIALNEPLIDAVLGPNRLYLLTATTLRTVNCCN